MIIVNTLGWGQSVPENMKRETTFDDNSIGRCSEDSPDAAETVSAGNNLTLCCADVQAFGVT